MGTPTPSKSRTGSRGHNKLDLLQEHFNFWIKNLFNSKSHDFASKHLSEAVGLNIQGFTELRDHAREIFGLTRAFITGGTKYCNLFPAGQVYVYVVRDEFSEGYNILAKGQLKSFLDRTKWSGSTEVVDDGSSIAPMQPPDLDEEERISSNPITFRGGTSETTEFHFY
ncbi:hypothetical protein C8J56DRAFT_1043378 [Mycena floridula]|nr:hypothetical protein C8J56DRAFT_1043378 [Mycena floridula]